MGEGAQAGAAAVVAGDVAPGAVRLRRLVRHGYLIGRRDHGPAFVADVRAGELVVVGAVTFTAGDRLRQAHCSLTALRTTAMILTSARNLSMDRAPFTWWFGDSTKHSTYTVLCA